MIITSYNHEYIKKKTFFAYNSLYDKISYLNLKKANSNFRLKYQQ